MNEVLQTMLAIQLLNQDTDKNLIIYKEDSQKKYNISLCESLELAFNEGLSITLLINEKQTLTTKNNDTIGENGKITFIEKLMSNNRDNKTVISYLYNKIEKNDLSKMSEKCVSNIFSILRDNKISVKKFFELNFDFKQGNFDEYAKVCMADIDFFKCCLSFKPDFDFNFKYMEKTLKEWLIEEMDYLKNNNSEYRDHEELLNFIDKAIVKQNLENSMIRKNSKETIFKI